jgi:hypothetical protein
VLKDGPYIGGFVKAAREYDDVQPVGILSPRDARGGSSGSWITQEAFDKCTSGFVEDLKAQGPFVYHVFDHYFGRPATDWIAAFREQRTENLRKAWDAETQAARDRRGETRPSLPLDAYAGDYDDAWYGRVAIAKEGDGLVLRMTHSPALVAELRHWQHDTFRAVFREKTTPDAYVTFALDHAGRIALVSMVPCSTLADFSFDYQDLNLRPAPKPAPAPRPSGQ